MQTVSVVVPAYTLDRWHHIEACIESLLTQKIVPEQIILCIDNNLDLLEAARKSFAGDASRQIAVIENPDREHLLGRDTHARIHGQRRRFGAGSARNAAAALVHSDVIAFIDDDAWAEPDWLARISTHFEDPGIVAVGGAPIPEYETARPDWFPASFDWVFGCAYRGLPDEPAPAKHLIGANMAVRRSSFEAVGGFHSVDFDDLDMCMRLGHSFGSAALIYDPAIRVHHYVPAARVTWRYFTRRCFYVNAEKVGAFREMGAASNLSAEVKFVIDAMTTEVAYETRRAVRERSWAGLLAVGAIAVGVGLAGLGNLWGRLVALRQTRWPRRRGEGIR